MYQKIKTTALCTFLVATFSNSVCASFSQVKKSDELACRNFVQTFYNGYSAKMRKGTSPSYNDPHYSKDLVKQLKEDELASSKNKGEIVGLDFDPVLATNAEPAQRYIAEKVTAHGDGFWVDIYEISSGKKSPKPIVSPELHKIDQKWIITDFHYPKSDFPVNDNLLSVLKKLREDRQTYSKK